jgi:hypothetical protein
MDYVYTDADEGRTFETIAEKRHPMTRSILRSVRFAFVTLLLGLTAYTVLEAALGGGRTTIAAQPAGDGLSTCGSAEQPCRLETLDVVAQAAPASTLLAAEGMPSCGTEAQPCQLEPVAVEAQRESVHLAATERNVGMTMRVRS